MADTFVYDDLPWEEIEGAPPAEYIADVRKEQFQQSTTLNHYLFSQALQMQRMVMEAPDLQALLEVLLVSAPRHLGFRVSELWLYDPEHVLAGLITSGDRYGECLNLRHDLFDMQELYDLEPAVKLIGATDSRMFDILKGDQAIQHALLMPLTDSGRLMGSFHCGFTDTPVTLNPNPDEVVLIEHVAALLSVAFKNAVSRLQISQLTMLDPLTQISNLRGFEKDIAREVARARRADQSLTILMMEIDEFEELYQQYGEVAGRFVLKKVTERVSSGLRATDYLARLSDSRLAVLLPATGEESSTEVAQRLRKDIEEFLIDDGRGAVLEVTLSIGLVTWEPHQYPAIDMAQLARQIQAAGSRAVEISVAGKGNQVNVSRLPTLIN